MTIFGLKIGWFLSGRKYRRKRVSRFERIAGASLLDAANRDTRVLARVIDKYGQILKVPEEGRENKLNDLRDWLYWEAARSLVKEQRREMDYFIDGIVNRVMGISNMTGDQPDFTGKIVQLPGMKKGRQKISPELMNLLVKLGKYRREKENKKSFQW